MRKWLVPLALFGGVALAANDGYQSGIVWPEPPIVTPADQPNAPPSDAKVLLGDNLDAWNGGQNWDMTAGVATAKKSRVTTKESFGDCQLHLEFATPSQVKGNGQGRGNNGVLFGGYYEVQILDSYDNKTYFDGQCAALYKQSPPMVNVSKKPGEWQTYDIVYEAPRFENKKLTKPAIFTVFHNGVLVQNHVELTGGTFYDKAPKYTPHPVETPIQLYYHGDPVKFRNIWIRELHPLVGKKKEG